MGIIIMGEGPKGLVGRCIIVPRAGAVVDSED